MSQVLLRSRRRPAEPGRQNRETSEAGLLGHARRSEARLARSVTFTTSVSSHNQNNVTDELLMQAVQGGHLDALGELFERYHRPTFLFLSRTTGDPAAAEDRVQSKVRVKEAGEGGVNS